MATGTHSEEELKLVREVLGREIETINDYQTLLGQAQTEPLKAFLSHIIEEEKEHVAEALELIKEMDPVQAQLLKSGHVATPTTPSLEAPQVEPQRPPRLTVGSLRPGGPR